MDTNRLIKIEELEVGDEVIAAANGQLRYYKILREPKINPKTGRWSGVRCSFKADEKKTVYGAGTKYARTRIHTTYYCTPDEHNCEKMIYGLNYRDMWLVKRGGII